MAAWRSWCPTTRPGPQRFQAASAELLAATDHPFLGLEHIGSTSVPGLAAKPTIDMMANVRRLPDGHAAQPALAALGYELADTGMRERLFFQRLGGPGVSTHHLHVVTEDSWATRNERLLRTGAEAVEGKAHRRVPGAGRDLLRAGVGGDPERNGSVAKVMKAQAQARDPDHENEEPPKAPPDVTQPTWLQRGPGRTHKSEGDRDARLEAESTPKQHAGRLGR